MRRLLSWVTALGLVALTFAASAATHKKSVGKKGTKAASSARKKAGKKGSVKRTTWRNRQLAPTPERYKEIQAALSAKGYLNAEQANGQWTDTSAAALKKFQADQNIEANGKINSLSLIALGLGPKRELATGGSPAAPPPVEP